MFISMSCLHVHVCMSMSPFLCLYVDVSMSMSASPCPCLYFSMFPCLMSMYPCLHLQAFISVSPCFHVSIYEDKYKSFRNSANGTIMENGNFFLFAENRSGNDKLPSVCSKRKRKFIFLGRQTINDN
jgi:hypothetical protein